jgi:hypothetical protein
MQIVACPHCSGRVSNDGTLGGQVVNCPMCGGQFQMPPLQQASRKQDRPSYWEEKEAGEARLKPLRRRSKDTKRAYDSAFWIAVGIATAGFLSRIIAWCFVDEKLAAVPVALQWNLAFVVMWPFAAAWSYIRMNRPFLLGAVACGLIAIILGVTSATPAADLLMAVLVWVPLISLALLARRWCIAAEELKAADKEEEDRLDAIAAEEQAQERARLKRKATRCPSCRKAHAKEQVGCTPIDHAFKEVMAIWRESAYSGPVSLGVVEKRGLRQIQVTRYRVTYRCKFCSHVWERDTDFLRHEPLGDDEIDERMEQGDLDLRF